MSVETKETVDSSPQSLAYVVESVRRTASSSWMPPSCPLSSSAVQSALLSRSFRRRGSKRWHSNISSVTPAASLKRLVPLVDFLAVWKLLPNVSKWVLQTVESPPSFNGVIPTLVGPEQALVMIFSWGRGPENVFLLQVRQPLGHRSKEGWGVATDLRSVSCEPHYQTNTFSSRCSLSSS